jgi:hypothetical protein
MTTISTALNPYAQRGMIRDQARFVGRERELDQIFSSLRTMQSVSVVGERRIGKSSLLYHIVQTGRERLGENYTCHYLDLQLVLSTEEFFDRACELLDAEGDTHRDFEEAIKGKKIILCLDEFEQATNNSAFGEEFFNILRSLAQTGELALVVATQHTLPELYRSGAIPTSPFFNIFTVLRLGPLPEAEARELVSRPVERNGQSFSASEVDFILGLAGTHPYRLNVACELLYEAKLSGAVDFTQVRRKFEDEMRNGKPSRLPSEERLTTGKWVGTIWAAVLALASILITWLSVRENNSIGLFMSVGLAIIALWLFVMDSLPTLRSRGGTR